VLPGDYEVRERAGFRLTPSLRSTLIFSSAFHTLLGGTKLVLLSKNLLLVLCALLLVVVYTLAGVAQGYGLLLYLLPLLFYELAVLLAGNP
jgi:hypothetical protein